MTTRTIGSAAAAVALTGVSLLGAAPALAQANEACYPPPCAAGVSDSTVTPGQTVTFTSGSGSFTAGDDVEVRVLGETFTRQADASGSANLTYTVPEDTRPGRYEAVFSNASNTVRVPFTVVAAAAAAPGRGQLPRTGSDALLELTVAGTALVAVGATMVVVARRRRGVGPTTVA